MPALQNDLDIREALFGLKEMLTIQQVRFVGARLRELLVRYDNASCDKRLQPIEWTEWPAFSDAAYFCGFVCHDGGKHMGDLEKTPVLEFMQRLEGELRLVDAVCLRNLRMILHYSMRSNRWGDGGADTDGGAFWVLIMSRMGSAIPFRLGA